MGLLDMAMSPEQPQGQPPQGQPPQGQPAQGPQGLIGGQQISPEILKESKKLAEMLYQNPTAEMAKAVVDKLEEIGAPNINQVAEMIVQIKDNPKMLKETAAHVLKSMEGI